MVKQNMDPATRVLPPTWRIVMLSALDLARRIEHGELPLAAVPAALTVQVPADPEMEHESHGLAQAVLQQ